MSLTDIDVPAQITELARDARRVEFFTGAGMSAESGLATFRDAQTGLWSKVDPQAMANFDAWRAGPGKIWPWYLWRMKLARDAEPNPGHRAIAAWCRALDRDSGWGHVTTQNIDDLHERGGVGDDRIAHLHGSLFGFRCDHCGAPAKEPDLPDEPVEHLMPPFCEACQMGFVRPGVVWFGEPLPMREWSEAEDHARSCDLMIVVGTSGVVFPAAGLPLDAVASGLPVIEISPEPTDFSPHATHSWRTTAGVGLPALAEAAGVDLV
ncbi:NAD-dependent deacylase [uncultured Corynebacterium sp.]|uniref:NAD-dependent deacylase n=1 Tax=uncultured Corynebacterium sp. TaxID=159447 RepID=UPI0025D31363|nr:NAD-dependent deacylase [uncultured Corynebacterium sp.]